jgi:hypothetical protein
MSLIRKLSKFICCVMGEALFVLILGCWFGVVRKGACDVAPHSHGCPINIGSCSLVEKNIFATPPTATEKQPKPKKQPKPQTTMWHPKNRSIPHEEKKTKFAFL